MQPIPLKCEVCGNGGVAAELLGVKLCSACTNIAAKSMNEINVAVHDIVIATVREIMPKAPLQLREVEDKDRDRENKERL